MKLSHKPILLLFTITSITVLSCKKDNRTSNSINTFPKTFQYQGVTLSTERVFTYQGEVTNPAIKTKAIASTGLNLISHPAQNDLTFTSPKAIKIVADHYHLTSSAGGKQAFFNDVDSEISLDNGDDIRAVLSPFYKIFNILHENNKDTYTSSLVVTGDNSETKIIGLDICFLHRDPVTNKLIGRFMTSSSNEFNLPGVNMALDKNDTIAIREFTSNYAIKK
jgi:hypothetical protein